MVEILVKAGSSIGERGGHATVQTSAGVVYVVSVQQFGDNRLGISKKVAGVFSEQDNANRPVEILNPNPSIAIDSNDIIHIFWFTFTGAPDSFVYTTFNTSTDTWSGTIETVRLLTSSISDEGTDIAIDSNDIPHVTFIDGLGATDKQIMYSNRIGGSFKTPVQVDSTTNNYRPPSIIIGIPTNAIGADRPIIAYNERTVGEVFVRHGDALDATSFASVFSVTSNVETNTSAMIAGDENNFVHLCYNHLVNGIQYQTHDPADVWGTWSAQTLIDSTINYTLLSIATFGGFPHIFAIQSVAPNAFDIILHKDLGSGFTKTVLNSGDMFTAAIVKWSKYANNNPEQLDYAIRDNTNGDVDWDTFTATSEVTPNGVVFEEKNVFRNTSGDVYVLYDDNVTANRLTVSKLVAGVWTIQDSGNRPSNVTEAYSGAMDSTGKIHVAWFDSSTTNNDLTYRVFDTATDLWVGANETVTVGTNTAQFNRAIIAIDVNDIPHIAYNWATTGSGGLDHVFYKNRIGGAWNAEVAVATAENTEGVDLIIGIPTTAVGADRPIILAVKRSPREVEFLHGNALNATSFVSSGDLFLTQGPVDDGVKIAIDGKNFIHCSFGGATIDSLFYTTHDPANAWATWATPTVVDTDNSFREHNIAVLPNGISQATGIHIIAIPLSGVNARDVVMYIDKGSGFVKTVLSVGVAFVNVATRSAKYGNNFPFTLDFNWAFDTTSPILYDLFQADPNFNFTVDAILVTPPITTTFTVNAIVVARNDLTFDVNALLQKTQDNDFTVNAILIAGQIFDFTVDALVQKSQTQTFDVNALLQATQTQTFTVDAILQATQTLDFTVDALLGAMPAFLFDVNALLQATQTQTFTVNAIVVNRNTTTWTNDARLSALNEFTVDAIVVLRFDNTFTVNALIRAINTITWTNNARILAIQDNEFTVDARIIDINQIVFAVNALITTVKTTTFDVDAILVKAVQFTVDAVLIPEHGEFEFSDVHLQDVAHLFEPPRNNFDVDALLQALGQTFDFTVDALLAEAKVNDFTVDGLLAIMPAFMFDVNALLKALNQTLAFTVNAIVVNRNQTTFTVDAILAQILEFTVDGIVVNRFDNDFTVDAIIVRENQFTADAILQRIQTFDFDVDAQIQQQNINFDFTVDGIPSTPVDFTFTVDALLRKVQTLDFTVDALLTGINRFTVDAIIVAKVDNDFTVDGLLRIVQTDDFDVNAILIKVQDNTFTVDAIIVPITAEIDIQLVTFQTPPQPAIFFEVNARVTARNDLTFIVDGLVEAMPRVEFTVDALLAERQEFEFTVDGLIAKFARLVHTSIIRENLKTVSVIRRRSP